MNYDELEEELKHLKPRTKLFELLKRELSKQGRWKHLRRGKPFKASDTRRKKL